MRRIPRHPPLFDPPAARAARNSGIATAEEHADVDWMQAAYDSGIDCSSYYRNFNTDEMWKELANNHPGVHTHQPSAMGRVMQWLAEDGYIEKIKGDWRPTKIPRRHRELQQWKSLNFGANKLSTVELFMRQKGNGNGSH